MMRRVLPILALLALASPAIAQTDVRAAALRDVALSDRTAYELVRSLTAEVGARPAGSPAMERARDWGLANLQRLGFENVRAEPFTITAWRRGAESAAIVSPVARPLAVLGLGRSVPTPAGGVQAEVVVFDSYEAMLARPSGSLTGRIALVNQPMARTQDGSGYGAINRMRTQGASEAARRGAVAYLVRSLSTDDGPAPHTGAMRYAADAPQIPAAALSPPDADAVAGLARAGAVSLRLVLNSTTAPAQAWNVVGEIRGSAAPDEIVVIGGHLDTWDAGSGAVDDGAGVALTMAAAKLIRPASPRRTVRVVLWGAEEIDESGAAYARAHAGEAAKTVLAGESDAGAARIFSVRLPPGGESKPELAGLPQIVAPLRIFVAREAATSGGADVSPLQAAGVPVFSLRQDMTRYFDWHHSADDTLDKVDPAELAQNVAAWASFIYLVADSAVDFRSAPTVGQGQ